MLIKQYDNYYPIDDFHVNGEFTLGENIADLGGVNLALDAFKKTAGYGAQETDSGGFTPDRKFFLAQANIWKNNINGENLILRLKTDPHSPAKYRVNGPLSNMPEFYNAFGVKPGDGMYRGANERASIW